MRKKQIITGALDAIRRKIAGSTRFKEPVYHYGATPDHSAIDRFVTDYGDPNKITSLDAAGTHVGSKQAANDRFQQRLEHVYDYGDGGAPEYMAEGSVMPLMADLSKPYIPEGAPMAERDFQRLFPKGGLKWLSDEGYTNVPYVNDHEDWGALSHIMLPKGEDLKTTPHLRSVFARLEELLGPSIMGSTGVAGLFGAFDE